jgi:hypothetical protein
MPKCRLLLAPAKGKKFNPLKTQKNGGQKDFFACRLAGFDGKATEEINPSPKNPL